LDEANGLASDEVLPLVDADGIPIESPVRQVLREGVILGLAEGTRLLRRDGQYVAVEDSAAPIRDEKKRITGVVIILREAEGQERLRAQLQQTAEQLRQSQKMEAVGQLAGGIAHDFNNLITVIVGYSEMLQRVVPRSKEVSGPLDNILYAGQRAAELTHRLLAFSRKQIVRLEPLSLGEVVAGMTGMLERVISEDIELQVRSGDGIQRVKGDRAQIEQIVLNLATNARDAMPDGGRLQLTTSSVDLTAVSNEVGEGLLPGSYAVLEVTDTGTGMDDTTRERLFEPFFTTKPVGKGTGLGLSTVYGVVREHGGTIRVSSEPGHGSTFRVYLPRLQHAESRAQVGTAEPEAAGGSETILIVEDNVPLRSLIERILDRASYVTISCADGATALERARSAAKIDAVLLDVVLPRIPGYELAKQLKALRPHAKVLMMSGYGEEAMGASARLPILHAPFIQKPFSGQQLCARLRQVLDTPAS
jgi:two-component system cell cycle sensor histidine kinase/response regulator CckA